MSTEFSFRFLEQWKNLGFTGIKCQKLGTAVHLSPVLYDENVNIENAYVIPIDDDQVREMANGSDVVRFYVTE